MAHRRWPSLVQVTRAALLFAAFPSLAAAQSWLPVGPTGGDVRSLAFNPRDPQVVYLGTADGVLYRSEDGGMHWRPMTPGFPLRGHSLDDLLVTPSGDVLVGYWKVADDGGGVARSVDGGRSFALLPDIAGQAVRALALAPSTPDVLVAGTLTGVFRTDDGGKSWRRISPEGHADIRNVGSVVFDRNDPDVVYAGTWHLPWKTTNGGKTWTSVHAGMIKDSDVMTLTLDGRTPTTIYATACSGIYRSVDSAARWAKIPGIPSSSRRTRAFAQNPKRPEALYAGTTEGLWISDDGARTWRLATSKKLVVNAIAALPDGTLLLGADGAGVLRSTDDGKTWMASNEGFLERPISRVVFDGKNGRVLVAILGDRQHGGVFTAPGPDGPWTQLGAGIEGREVLTVATAGTDVLAGTDDGVFLFSSPAPPSRSGFTPGVTDAGWRRLSTAIEGIDTRPRVTHVVALSETVFLAATSRGLMRSADRGATWERRSLGTSHVAVSLVASTRQPGLVIAATPLGLFRSGDSGASWSEVGPTPSEGIIHRLAFLPGDDDVLFAATTRGLFRSADQGHTWSHRGGGLPLGHIADLALHPDGRTIYAGHYSHGGLYKSQDGGISWTPLTTEGLRSGRIWAVALDPDAPERLVAAAPTGGLHRLAEVAAASAAGASKAAQ